MTVVMTSGWCHAAERKGQSINLLRLTPSFGFPHSHRILGPGLPLFGRHVCSSCFTAGAAAFLASLCSHLSEPLDDLRRKLLARHLDHGTPGPCISISGS